MRSPEQVEAWVLSIVDRVRKKQRIEDDRVELKAEWPEIAKAARRVAGHANASVETRCFGSSGSTRNEAWFTPYPISRRTPLRGWENCSMGD